MNCRDAVFLECGYGFRLFGFDSIFRPPATARHALESSKTKTDLWPVPRVTHQLLHDLYIGPFRDALVVEVQRPVRRHETDIVLLRFIV